MTHPFLNTLVLSFPTSVLYYSANVLGQLVPSDTATLSSLSSFDLLLRRLSSSDHHNSPSRSSISQVVSICLLIRLLSYLSTQVCLLSDKIEAKLSVCSWGNGLDLELERTGGRSIKFLKSDDLLNDLQYTLTWRLGLERLKHKQQLVYWFMAHVPRMVFDLVPKQSSTLGMRMVVSGCT